MSQNRESAAAGLDGAPRRHSVLFATGATRLLTVGVDMKHKEIVQIRGPRNRLPEANEMTVVNRRACANGLTTAAWVG